MNPTESATAAAPAAALPPPPKVTQTDQVSTLLELIVDESDRRALVAQELTRLNFNQNYRLAEMFAAAGYFDSNGYNSPPMSAAQAMAKIAVGENWGLNPADSIRFIYIVGGKPSIEEAVFAARMQEAGWGWDIQFIGGQGSGCKGVRLFAEKDGRPVMKPVRDDATGEIKPGADGKPLMRQAFAEFTEEQAAQIKIWQNKQQVSLLNKSGPWSDGRRSNMYYWRALSQFRRWFCPQVMKGALLRDEAQDIIGPIHELPVYEGDPRKMVLAAASEALKQQPKSAAAPEPETKPEPEPAPQPATLRAILKYDAYLMTNVFQAILDANFYATVADIKTEAAAAKLLQELEAAKEAAKAKGK